METHIFLHFRRFFVIIFFIMMTIFPTVFGLSVSRTISGQSCLQAPEALPSLTWQMSYFSERVMFKRPATA